jgi:hypothetical protein
MRSSLVWLWCPEADMSDKSGFNGNGCGGNVLTWDGFIIEGLNRWETNKQGRLSLPRTTLHSLHKHLLPIRTAFIAQAFIAHLSCIRLYCTSAFLKLPSEPQTPSTSSLRSDSVLTALGTKFCRQLTFCHTISPYIKSTKQSLIYWKKCDAPQQPLSLSRLLRCTQRFFRGMHSGFLAKVTTRTRWMLDGRMYDEIDAGLLGVDSPTST